MNAFTIDFFKAAVSDLSSRRKQTDDHRKVIETAEQMWVYSRDTDIERWANGTLKRVPRARLLKLYPTVCRLMDKFDPSNSWGTSTHEKWRIIECAWGLANLRWIHQDIAGRQPHLEYTPDEIRVWLEERRTFQMSMFEVSP